MLSEEFWWMALAIAGCSALVHLFTMLGTHWGDRRVSTKALGFSLLFHAALVFALFAVGPRIERYIAQSDEVVIPEEDNQPIEITSIESEADQIQRHVEEGNVPIWNQPNKPILSPIERSPQDVELSADEDPTRIVQELTSRPSQVPPADTLADLPDVGAPEGIESPIEDLQPTPAAAPTLAAPNLMDSKADDRPAMVRTDLSTEFEEGALERSEWQPTPEASERPTTNPDPLDLLADLSGADDPAMLPETESSFDGMRIRPPETPQTLPEESNPTDHNLASGSSGNQRMNSRIGRRGIDTEIGRAETPAPALERGELPSELEMPSGTAPELASLPPIDPLGVDEPALAPTDDSAPLIRQRTLPETYQLRRLDTRGEVARSNGGTAQSEQAVELSLEWLAAHQTPMGYWDADRFDAGQVGIDEDGINRQHAGQTADTGLTALTILAFLGAGYTHDDGRYAKTVDKALNWLIENQDADGFLGGNAAHFEKMYCHGMATYAIAEAHAMEKDRRNSKLRRPLINAVLYITSQQGEDGGWRYVKGQDGDMSMFGWQLMALKSAEVAGVPMPRSTRVKMVEFLRDRSLGRHGGLAGYRDGTPATAPMTAEALFCKQMLGITRANPQSTEAVDFLKDHLPRRSQLNYYYWYYGTLAMYHFGGDAWEKWNQALRDLLIAEQVKEGELAGSWDPKDEWGPYGGRIYSTAVATLSLEVYYRFLPLYRAVGQD